MSTPQPAPPSAGKPLASAIQLWMRTDQPRQAGIDHWKGPHSGIIANTPGLREYRQIHLTEDNPGRWPAGPGTETAIPQEWKVDGIADVTFQSALSPLKGRAQTRKAYADEINVFRRTLLYTGTPHAARWWDVNPDGKHVGARAVIYLQRRPGTSGRALRAFVTARMVPLLGGTAGLTELRTHNYLPWNEKLWDTPNVAHDNPRDRRFHACVVPGFGDETARDDFYTGATVRTLAEELTPLTSIVHAYDVASTLTFVKDSQVLAHPEL